MKVDVCRLPEAYTLEQTARSLMPRAKHNCKHCCGRQYGNGLYLKCRCCDHVTRDTVVEEAKMIDWPEEIRYADGIAVENILRDKAMLEGRP